MRRRVSIMAIVFALVTALAPSALADGHSGVYISLGDSLAAGYQAAPGGSTEFVTDDAYTDVLYQRVKDDLGLAQHVKLGCPGETSTTMIAGGCPTTGAPGVPVYATGTQLGDAVAAALAAGSDLELITIDIGANDVLVCAAAADPGACLATVLPTLVGNVTQIVATLQAVAPGVPIVAMNYYNPNLAWVVDPVNAPYPTFGADSQLLTATVNSALAFAYGGGLGFTAPIPVVDVATAFRTFDPDKGIRDVCRFTQMCEKEAGDYVMSDWSPAPGIQPDIHASDLGYKQIAWAFKSLMESLGII